MSNQHEAGPYKTVDYGNVYEIILADNRQMRQYINECEAQIDALRQELAGRQGWTPVNPVGMVNDEYADAEIKLCYRRLTPASQEAASDEGVG